MEYIIDSLWNEGIEVCLVKRREYDEEIVWWVDVVIVVGGDGIMLLVVSKVLDRFKLVIGVNIDLEWFEGYLCLFVWYIYFFLEVL